MIKNFFGITGLLIVLASTSGCALLLAGAAGGAGTAVWLSDKLTQEVNAPFEKTVKAAKSGLQKLDLEINKETKKDSLTQLISTYHDGKKIWIDIRQMTDKTTQIEVRVGFTGDEESARKVLDAILQAI